MPRPITSKTGAFHSYVNRPNWSYMFFKRCPLLFPNDVLVQNEDDGTVRKGYVTRRYSSAPLVSGVDGIPAHLWGGKIPLVDVRVGEEMLTGMAWRFRVLSDFDWEKLLPGSLLSDSEDSK